MYVLKLTRNGAGGGHREMDSSSAAATVVPPPSATRAHHDNTHVAPSLSCAADRKDDWLEEETKYGNLVIELLEPDMASQGGLFSSYLIMGRKEGSEPGQKLAEAIEKKGHQSTHNRRGGTPRPISSYPSVFNNSTSPLLPGLHTLWGTWPSGKGQAPSPPPGGRCP